ncbi:MAG: M55 family metallopeptidase [Thermoguttaceae bacterium]|nr:M55 family metallopeptidase [Thermoguttaceae bacterium]MDW8078758.1 M55 family metallopeptidase [Thermoguttaceae bacterium]
MTRSALATGARRPRWTFSAVAFLLMTSIFASSGAVAGQQEQPRNRKKIYVVTDLEGASGVYQFAQTRDAGPLNEKAKEYLMGDIAAVVRGLQAGGAEEIWILDGHGSGAVVPELMVPGAVYIVGRPRPVMYGLDETFSGLVQLGAHAMNGTPDGVLCHTQSSKTENRYWYNGVESGEIAQVAAYAGYFNVPTIMVTGDEAACREAKQFLGEAVVTVAVKKGISREAAVLRPFEETRRDLYEGAKKAMEAIPHCKPFKLATPIQAKKEYLIFDSPDGKPRLVVKEGVIEDVLKIFEF